MELYEIVYGKYECFVQMLYVCVLCASCGSTQYCILHGLQFVNAGRGCQRRPYGRAVSPSVYHIHMDAILANFHMCGIMVMLTAVFNMLVRNASPIGHMCVRCLMFNLSGPCELLFLLCFIASWT